MTRVLPFPPPKGPAVARRRPKPLGKQREKLVEKFMPYARAIAGSIVARLPSSFDVDDLYGGGAFGLYKAAVRFHLRAAPGDARPVDVRFKAYARLWIEGGCMEAVRRRSWTESTATRIEELPEAALVEVDPRQHPEALTLARERREAIAAALKSLPPVQAKVIQMKYGTGESLRSNAHNLGLSIAAAGEAHRAALRSLRRLKDVA